ncbi:hypothetical protein LTR08_009116 [Meristemomyces frigidus]|nr:hypothetical protein LTR08_009116 [Meristemomyces frigidus]
MPGLDLTHVSSNWKQLQGRIEREKKAAQSSDNALKRKRPDEKKPLPDHVYKQIRLAAAATANPGKRRPVSRRTMGTSDSRPAAPPPTRSQLATEHNLRPADLAAAYGSAPPTAGVTRPADVVNAGRHPTAKAGKYVALDCEMVGTGPPPHSDNLLARASAVNFHGEQLYDSFVLPPPGLRVHDYRTHVSGVKASHLVAGYARPFAQVQKDIAGLLEGRVLVGHAVRNDLQVLLLAHGKREVRDTSRYAKFRVESKGKPPALRNLMKAEFGLVVQTGEHSSVEDARAAMMLFRKEKAGFEEENRRLFGRARRGEQVGEGEDEEEEEEGEEDDDELLDGEDGEDGEDGGAAKGSTGLKAKKKRKKKKRTKRT